MCPAKMLPCFSQTRLPFRFLWENPLTKLKQKSTRWVARLTLGTLVLLTGQQCSAQEVHWNGNAGNGNFFDSNNWSPLGAPQIHDVIRIGNLPGTAGDDVMMGGDPTVLHGGLYLSNGVRLDTNGTELVSFDVVSLVGANTRLIARPAAGPNSSDLQGQIQLGEGTFLELHDNVSAVFFPNAWSFGTISGRGTMITNNFDNSGVIRPGGNGGIVLNAGQIQQNLQVNLDGSTGQGGIDLTTQFSQLHVNAGSLTDSFGGTISMAPGALLNMNIQEGWAAESIAEINVLGFFNNAASQINGSHLTFGGTMNVTLAEGKLRVNAPLTIQPTASINVGHTDLLEFDGATTVQGGTFTLGQFGTMQFDGPTTLSGGTFSTFANNFTDGTIAFNGSTTWNGTVEINGSARQQGNATVSGVSGATINANRFDMDGLSGNTIWNVNSNLTVNAEMIGTTSANRFDGTMNIAGGFFPSTTINLRDPAASWTMGGTLNLSGLSQLVETKVAGSRMIVQGDLNVTGGRVRINADTTLSDAGFAGPAQIAITGADTELRMHGQTLIESGVEFLGAGTIFNAASGSMLLESGADLSSIGLVNEGLFNVATRAGIASVDRFTNTGVWSVDIGGYLPGAEHDSLLVTSGMAQLGGTLAVNLIEFVGPDFIPQIGDEFTILTALAGISGTFSFDPMTNFQGRTYSWDVQYNPNDVTLQLSAVSVPEPRAGMILTLVGAIFGLRRSRPAIRSSRDVPKAEECRRQFSSISNLAAASISTESPRASSPGTGMRKRFSGVMLTMLLLSASTANADIVGLDGKPLQASIATQLKSALELLQAGRLKECQQAVRAAALTTNDIAHHDIIIAQWLFGLQNQLAGLELLEKLSRVEPKRQDLCMAFAEYARQQGRTFDALQLLSAAEQAEPDAKWSKSYRDSILTAIRTSKAMVAEMRQDWELASSLYEALYATHPNEVKYLVGLGRTAFYRHQADQALQFFMKAEALSKGALCARLQLARLYNSKGQAKSAEDNYRQAIGSRDSKLSQAARIEYAYWLLDQNRSVREIQKLVADMAQSIGDSSEVRLLAAMIKYAQAKYDEAEVTVARLSQANAQDLVASTILSWALIESRDEGKRARALQIAESNAKAQPNSSETLATLAWVHFRLGDKPTALGLAQKLVQRGGTFSRDATFFLAQILKAADFTTESQRLTEAYSQATGRFLNFERANLLEQSVPAKAG